MSFAAQPHRSECLVALGANLDRPERALADAVAALEKLSGTPLSVGRLIRTPAIGGPPGQGDFWNSVARLSFGGEPEELLPELHAIERGLGRERRTRWAARSIDLDLLLLDDRVVIEPGVRVPHPRMTFRPFVMRPAAEIAPGWRHPECDRTLAELDALSREGDDAVRVVGDATGELMRFLTKHRPDVEVRLEEATDRGGATRLTIDARRDPWPLPPSGPRLVLADGPAEHWRDEVAAALECVWPAA